MSTYPLRATTGANSASRRGPSGRGYPQLISIASPPPAADGAYRPRAPGNTLIPRLREAIHSLDSKMASLMSQRRDLESRLEQAVRLQSPVLRLPSELLSSIFIIGILGDAEEEDAFESGDEGKVSIGSIMLVCRYWLEVALATPLLWAKITVSPHHSLEKARRKLGRSKSCPLDISIDFGPRTEYYTSGVTEQVVHAMDLFRPALWRIKVFRLTVPNRPQAHAVLLRCQEDAPLLEVLSIRVYHAMQDDNYSLAPLPLFAGRTPRLKDVSLTSFNFGWDLRLVSRLRVLKLCGYFYPHTPSTKTLLGILRECPQLEEICLRNFPDVDCPPCFGDSEGFAFPPLTKVVHLPRLKKASFYSAGIAMTQQLMAQFSFPNLECLELCFLENVTPILQLVYTQALTRLPLRHLRIETCVFNELKLLNLLRRLTSLVSLELVDCEEASSGLFRGLSGSQPWVCPKLESLTLDGCTSLDWDSLRTFVESRLPANSYAYSHFQNGAQGFRSSQATITSASTAAAAHARLRSSHPPARNVHPPVFLGPIRLRAIDVTRCSQISKEMVQWLRMYVASVKCERAKGIWGEPMP
ncbi:F-box domain-containing protein [Mycena sanguinolenta]|uniref:F-box domain-containing protein n=1 Tax=Mycena sanguinolenta TaxID=230812 RepID=A0A8H7CSA5_9AGAR|nr:F-box domain-containing protein [Mycena sanguinolenta]